MISSADMLPRGTQRGSASRCVHKARRMASEADDETFYDAEEEPTGDVVTDTVITEPSLAAGAGAAPQTTAGAQREQDSQVYDSTHAEEGSEGDNGSGEEEDDDDGDDEAAWNALDKQEQEQRRAQSQQFKAEGNKHYANARFEEALQCYSDAISTAAYARHPDVAIFFGNRAACQLRLQRYEQALNDCTNALAVQPNYTKVLLRRAEVHEAMGTLAEGVTDLKRVLELEPDNTVARQRLPRAEKAAAEKFEREKEEMLNKLKGLGNSLLGKFGLSTDNFQTVQDPNTGSYSINFVQKPGQGGAQ